MESWFVRVAKKSAKLTSNPKPKSAMTEKTTIATAKSTKVAGIVWMAKFSLVAQLSESVAKVANYAPMANGARVISKSPLPTKCAMAKTTTATAKPMKN
jgi:hypothetical protein